MQPSDYFLASIDDPRLRAAVQRIAPRLDRLSHHLREIAMQLHFTPNHLARQRNLSESTVRKYIDNLYKALDVRNDIDANVFDRTTLICFAAQYWRMRRQEDQNEMDTTGW
ncbi:hypothetical protein [uncultured Chloroflexus sp.]|uniref:hypothetical protein n=1 Tax=uncultured Chloroflexus sp. TaxID=214040 RepID=UPI0026133EE3|nr:hypothetical protein [uncultured Chloroflexus sp.]